MALIRRVDGVGGVIAAVWVGLCVGCGDSGGGSASQSASESQSGSDASTGTGTATAPTGSDSMSASTTGAEGSMSESLSGTTAADGSMSESLSGTNGSGVESESVSGSTSGTTGMVSGGGETTGTTGEPPVICGDIENEADCVQAGCLAFIGRLFVTNDADLCLDPPSFLGCGDPAPCAAVETYACKGMNKYQLPSACIPVGYMNCAKPPDAGGDGWPDCN
ncbi:MAG: hypothetical protein IPO88_27490 [Nannocystis sp.]|uniref:hypothetical protein n=1 Tax=Nannocystis sp. TaxID=1962667 RepID=UPI002429B5A5|nr:hypothetical protein [Nannocystis sp.]MBK9757173.1 hypothetical protein [Nannocystis sp.]